MFASFALASTLWLSQAPAPRTKSPPPKPNPPPPYSTTRALPPDAPPPKGTVSPTPSIDWSKVGPMSRKPKNEVLIKKELELFVMQEDQLAANRDHEGRLSRIDFPVTLVTDDPRGVIETQSLTREQYFAEMKPFWNTQPPATHKLTISVLSDSLASVVDDYTFTVGTQRVIARSSSLLIKRGGQWKWKSMVEAGWGGLGPPAPAPGPAAAQPFAPLKGAPVMDPVTPQPVAPPPSPGPVAPAPTH